MTRVFVPQDLEFMDVAREQIAAVNGHRVNDRATADLMEHFYRP